MLRLTLVTAGFSLILGVLARRAGDYWGLRGGKGTAATGGVAIAGAWWLTVAGTRSFAPRQLLGLGLAMVPLLLVGLRDVRRPLRPLPQFLAQTTAAVLAVVIGGVSARSVTNPFGGLLSLNQWEVGSIAVPGAVLTVLWIVFLMNAVNFLDGVDGLAATVGAIGFLAIGAVSLLPYVNEPTVAVPAFLAAGATGGFLFWNLPPARLTLGTPGAWFIGFLLAVLSVQGSSKIATLAVVGAIPLLDAAAVVLARLRRRASPFRGDTTHLHHQLAARGWSPRRVLTLYTVCSAALGVAAVTLPTVAKLSLFTVSAAAALLFALRRRGALTGQREPSRLLP